VAAKETDKLSEELAQIERDIQTKEQQFLVSIDFGIELKHLHNIIISYPTCINNCCGFENYIYTE